MLTYGCVTCVPAYSDFVVIRMRPPPRSKRPDTLFPFTPLFRFLPRYPVLPATLLVRLAVDAKGRGRGLGTELLVNALRRCLRSETASLAVVVDAKDDAAASFYERHEFVKLAEQPNRLFIPMAEIEKLFGETEGLGTGLSP